jgi:hypothetical protein
VFFFGFKDREAFKQSDIHTHTFPPSKFQMAIYPTSLYPGFEPTAQGTLTAAFLAALSLSAQPWNRNHFAGDIYMQGKRGYKGPKRNRGKNA